jgi:uncharacterized protein
VASKHAHVIGIDDAPFAREHRGDVLVVATAFSSLRMEGVLSTKVRRDGRNATHALATLILSSRFAAHTQAILLQGIALAGFNVVDIHELRETTRIPVLVVARRRPRMDAIRDALLTHVPGGARKWSLIERAGPMEPTSGVFVQRAGLSIPEASAIITRFAIYGRIPEPLRAAHLIAGGVTDGHGRGRA